MDNEKIKQSDVPALREYMLALQNGRCCLCGHPIANGDAALDHDHTTGRVRGVLHKDCNILLGKIENFTKRHGKKIITEGRLSSFLKSTWYYMTDNYECNPLHYKHKTDTDKLRLKYQRLMKRSKKPETKAKYRQLIKELT